MLWKVSLKLFKAPTLNSTKVPDKGIPVIYIVILLGILFFVEFF